jgi:hypothetical protein
MGDHHRRTAEATGKHRMFFRQSSIAIAFTKLSAAYVKNQTWRTQPEM